MTYNNYKLFLKDIYFISKSCIYVSMCVCVCIVCIYSLYEFSVHRGRGIESPGPGVTRSYEHLNGISGDGACVLRSRQLSHLSIPTKIS